MGVWDAWWCVSIGRSFLIGLVSEGLGFSLFLSSVRSSVVVFISSRSFARRFFRSALFYLGGSSLDFYMFCCRCWSPFGFVQRGRGGCGLIVQQ